MLTRVMLSLLPVLLSSLGSFGLTQENDVKIDWSFFNCHIQLYEPCPSSKILFYLFTNKSDLPYRLDSSDPRLPTAVNSSLPLKVIIHGYAGRVLTDPTSQIRTEYQRTGGVNVLVVDWGRLAKLPCYPTAVLNTAQVGQCTAEFLAALVRRPGARPKYVHIIGFSLGAHIASFVSNYVHMATGRKIYRITGLDPALPLFANLKTSYKLDKKDARHVDIIHTNIGVFGKREPIGHVDFYVNEGSMQPSCHNHRNPSLCSHMLAPTYFAESISSPKGFWGTSCPSYLQYAWGWCPLLESVQPQARQRIQMGEHILKGARGVYIVKTALNPPYALG